MKYTKEFKEEVLQLSDKIGVRKNAEQLGLKYNTLTDWRKHRKEEVTRPRPSEDEQVRRIRELEQELAEVNRANDILKEALGFFAKDLINQYNPIIPLNIQNVNITFRGILCSSGRINAVFG